MAATKKKSTAKKNTTKKAAPKAPAKNAAAKTSKKQAVKKAAPAAAKGSSEKKATPKKESEKAAEANRKPVSANAKDDSNNTWMIVSIVLGILVILLVISIGIVYNNANNGADAGLVDETTDTSDDVNVPVDENVVSLLIVEDPSCDSCQVDLFATQVRDNLIDGLVYEKVDYESVEGAAIVEALDAKQVPIYLFSSNIEQRDDWVELEGAFLPVEFDGNSFYMLNPQFIPAKVLIEAPTVTESAIIIGDVDAPVTVIEFTDYECPFCAIAEGNEELVEQFRGQNPTYTPPIPAVIEEYVESGDVRIVFYNYPIAQLHPQAREVHNAALCANAQGEFEDYSRLIWDNRETWSEESQRKDILMGYAEDLSLDMSDFETCVDEATYDSQIDEEMALGQQYGVSGTPAFFIGRTFISGAQDFEVFEAAIESELNK